MKIVLRKYLHYVDYIFSFNSNIKYFAQIIVLANRLGLLVIIIITNVYLFLVNLNFNILPVVE